MTPFPGERASQPRVIRKVRNKNGEQGLYLHSFVHRLTELEQEPLTDVEFFEESLPVAD